MKRIKIITGTTIIAACLALVYSCNSASAYAPTHKDLDETMLDLKAFQENMGDEIKAGNLHDAVWLFDGLDSTLKVISVTFPEHRKLEKPFADYYNLKMKKPIGDIRSALKKNDTAAALQAYRVLVRRCNSCHKDLDINKEVKF